LLRVTAFTLNLRRGPSMEHEIIGTLEQGEVVTCLVVGGTGDWVRVQSKRGLKGWAHLSYLIVQRDKGSIVNEGLPPGGSNDTCDPLRGSGAVPHLHKAFHDMIAYAEGTRGVSKDGYDVMFGHATFPSCAKHPEQCRSFGNTCSTAAGRYQFLTQTWQNCMRALDIDDFEPESQEHGAGYLIGTVRRVTLPTDRPLTATEFENALSRLSYEWASLPPARYGQGVRTVSELRRVYCEAAQCR
jgi:muramidase (phage lysozyme)